MTKYYNFCFSEEEKNELLKSLPLGSKLRERIEKEEPNILSFLGTDKFPNFIPNMSYIGKTGEYDCFAPPPFFK